VQNRLPTGTNLNLATLDFKNFGQFLAAVNVSNNLGIDFGALKAAMTGTTLAGTPATETTRLSLGQAIQKYKTGVDAEVEATSALTAAEAEIAAAPTVATTSKNKTKKSA
jgi:hypothetical protein